MASPYLNELGGKSFPRFVFIWKVHIILEKSGDFQMVIKSLGEVLITYKFVFWHKL